MKDLDRLYMYLLSDNVEIFEEEIFKIIPELKFEKGFEQKSKWHCYDVWHHTIETIQACDMNKEDRLIMLLHDIGKPFSYQDEGEIRHFKGHAKKSKEISKNILERLGLDKEKIEIILKLIEMHSTKIKEDEITQDNISFYKRLLKIQKCDAKGYEIEHSNLILEELNKIKI